MVLGSVLVGEVKLHTGEVTLIQEIQGLGKQISLTQITFSSIFTFGLCTIGVSAQWPFWGVYVVLRNDLAGGQVEGKQNPIMRSEPHAVLPQHSSEDGVVRCDQVNVWQVFGQPYHFEG